MTKVHQIYQCQVCGNTVAVFEAGSGTLTCCSQPMRLMEENTVDAAQEKHVPVIQQQGDTVKVIVGDVPHPMESDHYIKWIILNTAEGITCRKELNPGEPPEAVFQVQGTGLVAREYCNLHGLWKAEA